MRTTNLAEVLTNNQVTNYLKHRIMKELVDQIKAEYEVFAKNAEAQVEKGNKAAGARARKAALNLMKAMKEFRKVSVEATK
jgi:signal transduction histidine kinase